MGPKQFTNFDPIGPPLGPTGPQRDPVDIQYDIQEIQWEHRFRDQAQKSKHIKSKHIWIQTR